MSNPKLIKIDLNSIKKNPDAGNRFSYIQGKPDVFISYSSKTHELPAILKDIGHLLSITGNFCRSYNHKVMLRKELTEEDLVFFKEQLKDFKYCVNHNVETLEHLPEPEYFYEYEDTVLKCIYCENEFPHTELLSNYSIDYDWSGLVCPICHQPDCVNIKYETIEQALKRRAKNVKS